MYKIIVKNKGVTAAACVKNVIFYYKILDKRMNLIGKNIDKNIC